VDGGAQLQESLGGAVERLSRDLYQDRSTVLRELVQNVVDNRYPENVQPELVLNLDALGLTLLNNEVGFNEADVQSICRINHSTKGDCGGTRDIEVTETIGHKGIGAKAMFGISDKPSIHSRGWHFGFDASSTGRGDTLNYLVPQWLAPAQKKSGPEWTTEIQMPFSDTLKQEDRDQLRQRLHDLDACLLLHIPRSLFSIRIEDSTSSPTLYRHFWKSILFQERHSDTVDAQLLRLHVDGPSADSKDVTFDYLVVTEHFCVRGFSRQMRLAVGLPLATVGVHATSGRPTQHPTFCYLPIRHFGFRLLLQANFEVTASRDDLHRSTWNAEIRRLTPGIIVRLLRTAQQWLSARVVPQSQAGLDSHLTAEEASQTVDLVAADPPVNRVSVCAVLGAMPLPGELRDFFAGIEAHVWDSIRREECVPTSEGKWIVPAKAVLPDPAFAELVPEDLLSRHLGLSYVHASFCPCAAVADALRILGCHRSLEVLGQLLERMCISADPLLQSLQWLARLLVTVSQLTLQDASLPGRSNSWQGRKVTDEQLGRIKKLRIIPVHAYDQLTSLAATAGQSDSLDLAAASDAELFLLPSEEDDANLRGLLHGFHMQVVHPSLFSCLTSLEAESVHRLLKTLGLQELSLPIAVVSCLVPECRRLRATVEERASRGQSEVEADCLEISTRCLHLLAAGWRRWDECQAMWRDRRRGEEFEQELMDVIRECLPLPCTVLSSRTASQSYKLVCWESRSEGCVVFPPAFHAMRRASGCYQGVREGEALQILSRFDFVKLLSPGGCPAFEFYILHEALLKPLGSVDATQL
ncbi:unnamed protein product, partial [Polarella glacialis]